MGTSKIKRKTNPATEPKKEPVRALFDPEIVSEEVLTSLQFASGLHFGGLDMTALVLEHRLDLILNQAWREVCPTLDIQDMWTLSQVGPYGLHDGLGKGLEDLESILGDSEDSEVDPDGAEKLLPMVRTWDMTTRWAVHRAVENSIEAARKRSGTRCVLLNKLVEDEFKKALAVATR